MIAPFPWPRTGPVRRRCKLNSCTFLGIFSQPAISTHKSGNSADISKEIFSELYREFESHLVRQQVIDIAEIIVVSLICATFPSVSVSIRENSKLRAQITAYSSD